MAASIENESEKEDTFTDNFVSFISPKKVNGEGVGRSYISTSSINETSLDDCIGGEFEEPVSKHRGFMTDTIPEMTRHEHSFLKVDKKEVNVGEDITVCWNVTEPCCANDWIGIFKSSEFYRVR